MVLGVPSRPDAPGSCARPSLGGSLPGLSLLVRVCPPFSALPGILILYGRLSFLSLKTRSTFDHRFRLLDCLCLFWNESLYLPLVAYLSHP